MERNGSVYRGVDVRHNWTPFCSVWMQVFAHIISYCKGDLETVDQKRSFSKLFSSVAQMYIIFLSTMLCKLCIPCQKVQIHRRKFVFIFHKLVVKLSNTSTMLFLPVAKSLSGSCPKPHEDRGPMLIYVWYVQHVFNV
jgi:hypothetical protein